MDVVDDLRRIAPHLPRGLQTRFESTFDHFDRSNRLLEIDRGMASFRAITGEEEAATALMRAVQIRNYDGSEKLKASRHHHKAAIVATITAIRNTVYPILAEFQLLFDFAKGRIDPKIPLTTFGVAGGEKLCIQPVEPLGLLQTREGVHELEVYDDALEQLARKTEPGTIIKPINAQANARNRLLYASDEALPQSRATASTIEERRHRALAILVLTAMVFQSRHHLDLVRQALATVLKVI